MSDTSLTDLQQDERDAMLGNRDALLRVVSGLRKYRALVRKLLGDGAHLPDVSLEVERIESND